MLRRFVGASGTYLTLRSDPHDLEPSTYRESLVEGEPDKCAHLPWSGVVPDPRNDLGSRGVSQVEGLDESYEVWRVRLFSSIVVPPLGSVAKERGVSEVRGGLPMPFPGVP